MALDEKLGIVYVPIGSAASDFYGGDRAGDNLFANTLLALNAQTGERIWHFQAIKHDIWDRDFPSPPTLVDVKRNGRTVRAVAQTSKQGWVYLFDRTNGQPLFPIEYRKYPPSTVPNEITADTQPLPVKPAPFARQVLTADMLTNRTPEAGQWALERFKTLANGGQFLPFSLGKDTVIFPGYDGGAEWGGSAADPETGWLYVNSNDIAWTGALAENRPGASGRQLYLSHCASCHSDDLKGAPPAMPSLVNLAERRKPQEVSRIIRQGAGRMPGFPNLRGPDLNALVQYMMSGEDKELAPATSSARERYRFTGYHKFLDPEGYPAVAPPWGTLNAINLHTGEYAWKIPFGEYPALAEKGMRDTGTENYGGPIVTAGGLLFIAATNFDRKFRAFDKRTGKLLWETTLPFAGNATPATYEVDGRQYVVIYATGGKGMQTDPTGNSYIAFALPARRK
jgi:quinoprotein glucose dehydrogenase